MFRFTVNFIFFAINSRLFLFAIARIFRKVRLITLAVNYIAIFSHDCKHYVIRSSYPEVFLEKGVSKIYSKFTGEHRWLPVIWIKLQSNLIEITLRHGCSPVNLLHIFRTPFPRNTSWWLLLNIFKTRRFIEKCPKNNYRNKKQSMTMFRSSFMMRSSFSLTK